MSFKTSRNPAGILAQPATSSVALSRTLVLNRLGDLQGKLTGRPCVGWLYIVPVHGELNEKDCGYTARIYHP